MHTLVTLLGDPRINDDGSYPETIYQFENGKKSSLTSYTSLAIKERFHPNRIVVLGTTKSAWHLLIKYCLLKSGKPSNQENFDALLTQLQLDYQRDCVKQSHLNKAANILSLHDSDKCIYELQLVPYGRNQNEQTETLQIMMGYFEEGNEAKEATLDVSYGLRHLPMLMQQSALLLQSLRNVKINNIFYGAFHIAKDNITPLMTLDGILEIDRWSKAFHRYEQDGDYTAFQEPLENEKMPNPALNALKEAAYYERTFNLTDASKQLDILKSHLPNQFDGIGGFFTERFKEHISWSDNSDLQQRQSELAHFYLKQGDFVRSAIFGVESFITSLVSPIDRATQHIFNTRHKYETAFISKADTSQLNTDYSYLKGIRNALAHGTPPDENTQKNERKKEIARKSLEMMQSPETLEAYLSNLFKKLGINP